MTTFKKATRLFSATLALILVIGVNISVAQSGTVVEVINDSENHTILSELLEITELGNVISQQGPFTVIAPTDEAFESMGPQLEELKNNPEQAESVVIGHLFQGQVSAAEVEPALEIEVAEGDIQATNGLVHVVDQVITQ